MTLTLTREMTPQEIEKYTQLARQKGYQDLEDCLQKQIDLILLALECPSDWDPGSLDDIEYVNRIDLEG